MTLAGFNPVYILTHLAALSGGALLTLLKFAKRLRITKAEEIMTTNKFESILKDVGKGLLFLFTNNTAKAIEVGGMNMAALIWPGLAPLFTKLSASIAKAQMQATVSTVGMTPEQILAMVIDDAQADFQTAGITETARQEAIVAAAIAFIDSIPSGSVNAAVVQSAVSAAAAVTPAAAPPAAAAPAAAAPAAPAPATYQAPA